MRTYVLAWVRYALVINVVLAVSPFEPVPAGALIPVAIKWSATGCIVLTRRRRTEIVCCRRRGEQHIIPLHELIVGVRLQAQIQLSLLESGEV